LNSSGNVTGKHTIVNRNELIEFGTVQRKGISWISVVAIPASGKLNPIFRFIHKN
jgi:hypothetical protein